MCRVSLLRIFYCFMLHSHATVSSVLCIVLVGSFCLYPTEVKPNSMCVARGCDFHINSSEGGPQQGIVSQCAASGRTERNGCVRRPNRAQLQCQFELTAPRSACVIIFAD